MPISLAKTSVPPFLLLILLSTATPSYSFSFSVSHYHTLLSLSHSLASLVANLPASRGDFSGASRAQYIARKIESFADLSSTVSDLYSFSFSLSHYHTLLWLSQSLASRVANLRASRGDFSGASRAQSIAQKIESLADLSSTVSDLDELLRALNELSRVNSDSERIAWVGRNYNRSLTVSLSLFVKPLKIFRQSGLLREVVETMQKEVEGDLFREVVETMQKEVVEGALLRDCLELGSNGLKGLTEVLKDIAVQYTASASRGTEL